MSDYIFISSPSSGGTFFRVYFEMYYKKGNQDCNAMNKAVFNDLSGKDLLAHHICFIAEKIRDNCPNLKIIHLVRNGLDVVNSRINRKHALSNNEFEYIKSIWRNDIEIATRLRGYENYLELRYEDLVNKQEVAVKKIEKFLGQTHQHSLKYLKSTVKDETGKHKDMQPSKLADIINIVKPVNKKLGYK